MSDAAQHVRAWDGPTRIVHWSLALLIVASWWTAENGELQWHRYSGYAIVGLLAFRLYWMFAGSATARLFAYLRAPRVIVDYAKRLLDRTPAAMARMGHNPLGALSALLLFSLLLAQVLLGAFAVDVDGIESGPLSHRVSFDLGRAFAELHHDLFDVLVVFIALHIAAVLFYLLYRRENLITPMVTGGPRLRVDAPASARRLPMTLRLLAGVVLGVSVAFAFARGFWL